MRTLLTTLLIALATSLYSQLSVWNDGVHVLSWDLDTDVEMVKVEHSADGFLFTELTTITDPYINQFEYLSLNRTNYYRLKIIGTDHSIEYSNEVLIRSTPMAHLTFINSLTIYNRYGKLINSKDLTPGVYFADYNGRWFKFEVL